MPWLLRMQSKASLRQFVKLYKERRFFFFFFFFERRPVGLMFTGVFKSSLSVFVAPTVFFFLRGGWFGEFLKESCMFTSLFTGFIQIV